MKQLFVGLVAFGFLLLGSPASAQTGEEPAPSTQVVTRVSIQDCSFQQIGEELSLECNISNKGAAVPDVHYLVQLLGTDQGNKYLIDQKILPESHTLQANSSIQKILSYTIPGYVSGQAEVWVKAVNSEGLLLSFVKAGTFTHTVFGEAAFIEANTCYVTVDGDQSETKYGITQGVDIHPTENLTAHCQVSNVGQSGLEVTPAFETYYRSLFGPKVEASSVNVSSLTLAPGETKEYTFPLPKALQPQAYDVAVTLRTQNGVVSNTVPIHYVIQGQSATIQNMSLDKESYGKGDTAVLSLFWSGSADQFPGSRAGDAADAVASAKVALLAGDRVCGEATQAITSDSPSSLTINVPVEKECASLRVRAQLLDGNGKVLAEKIVNFGSDESNEVGVGKSAEKPFTAYLIAGAALLGVLIVAAAYVMRRRANKRNGLSDHSNHSSNPPNPPITSFMFALLSFVFGLVVFFGNVPQASAESVGITLKTSDNIDIFFTFNLDKTTYAPGEAMNVSMSFSYIRCINGGFDVAMDATNYTPAAGENFNVEVGPPVSGSCGEGWCGSFAVPYGDIRETEFTAPTTPGTYKVQFKGAYKRYTYSGTTLTGSYLVWSDPVEITYTVGSASASAPDASFSANPTTVTAGGSSTLTYACANSTSASINNGVGAVTPVASGTRSVTPAATTTYILTCTGSGGLTDTAQATVTVVPPSSTNTLKVCQNSCSSGIQRGNHNTTQSFSLPQGSSQNLVACWNTSSTCNNASGDVTGSATWSENTGSNVVSLSGSNPKTVTGNTPGSEGISAAYSGQTANMTVNVACVAAVTCQSANQSGNYCQGQTFTVDNGCGTTLTCEGTRKCDFNWREVAP